MKKVHLQVSAICSHLPRNKQGKMRIDEFINLPILSEEAFDALDKYKCAKRLMDFEPVFTLGIKMVF